MESIRLVWLCDFVSRSGQVSHLCSTIKCKWFFLLQLKNKIWKCHNRISPESCAATVLKYNGTVSGSWLTTINLTWREQWWSCISLASHWECDSKLQIKIEIEGWSCVDFFPERFEKSLIQLQRLIWRVTWSAATLADCAGWLSLFGSLEYEGSGQREGTKEWLSKNCEQCRNLHKKRLHSDYHSGTKFGRASRVHTKCGCLWSINHSLARIRNPSILLSDSLFSCSSALNGQQFVLCVQSWCCSLLSMFTCHRISFNHKYT